MVSGFERTYAWMRPQFFCTASRYLTESVVSLSRSKVKVVELVMCSVIKINCSILCHTHDFVVRLWFVDLIVSRRLID